MLQRRVTTIVVNETHNYYVPHILFLNSIPQRLFFGDAGRCLLLSGIVVGSDDNDWGGIPPSHNPTQILSAILTCKGVRSFAFIPLGGGVGSRGGQGAYFLFPRHKLPVVSSPHRPNGCHGRRRRPGGPRAPALSSTRQRRVRPAGPPPVPVRTLSSSLVCRIGK